MITVYSSLLIASTAASHIILRSGFAAGVYARSDQAPKSTL